MNIEIHLYATLARYLPPDARDKSCSLSLPRGAAVMDVIKALGILESSVKLIFVNGVHGQRDTALADGDRVGLFPPVGGG